MTITHNRLIGLTGYERCGKDAFAAAFIKRGYVRMNFGDHIKAFFDDFTQGRVVPAELAVTMIENVSSGFTSADVADFIRDVAIPFAADADPISAFTEGPEKARLRPLLQRGGELAYDMLITSYFKAVDTALAGGARVISTRVGYNTVLKNSPEAQGLTERGGLIITIDRQNWAAGNRWDHEALEGLEGDGYVKMKVINDAADGEEWAQISEAVAEMLAEDDNFAEFSEATELQTVTPDDVIVTQLHHAADDGPDGSEEQVA